MWWSMTTPADSRDGGDSGETREVAGVAAGAGSVASVDGERCFNGDVNSFSIRIGGLDYRVCPVEAFEVVGLDVAGVDILGEIHEVAAGKDGDIIESPGRSPAMELRRG